MRVILHANQRPTQNHKDAILPILPQEQYLLGRELGLMLNQENILSLSDYSVSKKLIHLLRHGSLPRENDGATEFWRIKDDLQEHFLYCHHWSDEKWKRSMARGGGNKTRYQDSVSLILLYRTMSLFRTVSSSTFLSCRMCNQFTFHHQFRIDTGRSKF